MRPLGGRRWRGSGCPLNCCAVRVLKCARASLGSCHHDWLAHANRMLLPAVHAAQLAEQYLESIKGVGFYRANAGPNDAPRWEVSGAGLAWKDSVGCAVHVLASTSWSSAAADSD